MFKCIAASSARAAPDKPALYAATLIPADGSGTQSIRLSGGAGSFVSTMVIDGIYTLAEAPPAPTGN